MKALLTVLALVLVIAGITCYNVSITDSDITSEMGSTLSRGTPAAVLVAMLDSLHRKYGLHHGEIHYGNEVHGLPPLTGEANWLSASLRGPRVGLGEPFVEGIFLVFKFDDSLKLVAYDIDYGGAWP